MPLWWNTGCNVVFNQTSQRVNIQQREGSNKNLALGAGAADSFLGTLFPWCGSKEDIAAKGMILFRGALVGGTPILYLFQKAGVDQIYWCPYNGGIPTYENATFGGAHRSSYVDIQLRPNFTPLVIRAIE